MNEVPDRSIAHLDALLGQFGDQPAQGHIRPAGDPPQKPRPVFANQNARPIAPHLSRRRAARRAKALRPFHDARNAHPQRRRNRADRLARHHPRNRSITNPRNKAWSSMLASNPVPTLNQQKADLGIPRDLLKPHPALRLAILRNSLFFSLITGNLTRDGFAEDWLVSQAVQSPGFYFPVGENRRHFRGLGGHARHDSWQRRFHARFRPRPL